MMTYNIKNATYKMGKNATYKMKKATDKMKTGPKHEKNTTYKMKKMLKIKTQPITQY